MRKYPKEMWKPQERKPKRRLTSVVATTNPFSLAAMGALPGFSSSSRSIRALGKQASLRSVTVDSRLQFVSVDAVEAKIAKVRECTCAQAAVLLPGLPLSRTLTRAAAAYSQRVSTPKQTPAPPVQPYGLPATTLVPPYETPREEAQDSDGGEVTLAHLDERLRSRTAQAGGRSSPHQHSGTAFGFAGSSPSASHGQPQQTGAAQRRRNRASSGKRGAATREQLPTRSHNQQAFVSAGSRQHPRRTSPLRSPSPQQRSRKAWSPTPGGAASRPRSRPQSAAALRRAPSFAQTSFGSRSGMRKSSSAQMRHPGGKKRDERYAAGGRNVCSAVATVLSPSLFCRSPCSLSPNQAADWTEALPCNIPRCRQRQIPAGSRPRTCTDVC